MLAHQHVQRILIAAIFVVSSSAALADAIDGDWCLTDEAKQFRITGPAITTPAGTLTTGNYSRHSFFYVVPDGDPGAGEEISMQQLSEEMVEVSVNGGAPRIWRRCKLTS